MLKLQILAYREFQRIWTARRALCAIIFQRLSYSGFQKMTFPIQMHNRSERISRISMHLDAFTTK